LKNDGVTYIYQIEENPPKRLDEMNEYFIELKVENNPRYFSEFLHHYEKTLNHFAKNFIEKYNLEPERLLDLKQIFSVFVWELLKKHSLDDSQQLLYMVKYSLLHLWHDYVRLNCGAIVVPEAKSYSDMRSVARLYFENKDSMTTDELLKYITRETNLSEKKISQYIETALQFRYVSSISMDDEEVTEPNTVLEKTLADSAPSVFETVMYLDRREKYIQAAKALSPKDLKLLELSTGVCLNCLGTFEPKTYNEIALLLGMTDESGVEKKRKAVIKKFRDELEKLKFAK